MPFLDHLEELRWRILYSLLAVVIGSVIGWVVVTRVDVIAILKAPIAPLLPGGRLLFTSPTEPFFITLKLAFVAGLILASPVVIYQIWAFLAPALYDREKRLILPALTAGLGLFALGAAAAYFLVLPRALRVLFSFQAAELSPIITADKYFGFATQLIVGFGAVAELPLVIAILAALGLVTPQFLTRNRRYALLLSALVAAFLSPPDALSMVMMMVPLLLLYEVGIVCAWIMTRRRKRAERAAPRAATLTMILLLLGAAAAHAQVDSTRLQQIKQARSRGRPDSSARAGPGVPGQPVQGQPLDTATARRLGLPTAPTRTFPAADSVMDSLLALPGFRVTHYVADTLVLQGDSQIVFLRGEAFVDRDGTKLQADSIRYQEASCRLDAVGTPQLFDQSSVLVGEGMRYDTCVQRGTVTQALTSFQQGGGTWFMRGDLAVDSGSTRLYGASSEITSSDLPVPEYHFTAGEVKWLNKNVMVARPAVLYVRDVPIMWIPFIFQDIRTGRRSGVLIPHFGLSDLVRPTRSYQRSFTGLGYYWVPNDYLDFLASTDWYAGRALDFRGQLRYRWLDEFITGGFSYTRTEQLDANATASQITWTHQQAFSSRTHFNASINYATSGAVVQRNTIDPFVAIAQLSSSVNFDKRFDWGTLNMGGSRSQNLSTDLVQQTFPQVSLTPAPVSIGDEVTWSPGFSFTNVQTFHNNAGVLLAPLGGGVDSLPSLFDTRTTTFSLNTPIRIGRWNWSNSLTEVDATGSQRQTFTLTDSTRPDSIRTLQYGREFSTTLDWQTGINLPQLFSGTWKLQPGIAILNTTTAGPFMLRNQFTGGQWVHQGKRLAFQASSAPTFFGFFPGFGPLARIRHSIQLLVNYQYAPGAHVPDEFSRALDPTHRLLNAKSDPQQTISLGLSQTIEGKLKLPPGDTSSTAQARKIKILSLSTSAISYNFEQAKQPGRTGWQTQTLTNTMSSDLLPGFNIQLTHDLWAGPGGGAGIAGLATSRFSPFLETVSASASINGQTLKNIAGALGLGGGGGGPAAPAVPPPSGGAAPGTPPPGGGGVIVDQIGGVLSRPGAYSGGGQGFSLSLSYSSTKTRPSDSLAVAPPAGDPGANGYSVPPPLPNFGSGGRQQLTVALNFSPTPHWTASWNTQYDFETRQFAQQVLRLERDLHRWHASFNIVKSANGSFGFSVSVALVDEPDIKFDYRQQSFSEQP